MIEHDGQKFTDKAYEELSGCKVCSVCGIRKEVCLFKPVKRKSAKGIMICQFSSYCKVCHSNRVKADYAKNREKKLAQQKELNKKNIKEYREAKDRRDRKRRVTISHASPPWLTKEQRKEMNDYTREARRLTKETGVLHTADHIIPFNSKYVCGLHVPWNMRVILNTDNTSKHASIDNDLLSDLHPNYHPCEETPELAYMAEKHILVWR